jgi:hypothetical protein
MKDLIKETVYGLTGEYGLVAKVVELTQKGNDVCIHSTHAMGLGTYLLAYKPAPVEDLVDDEIIGPSLGDDDQTLDEVTEKEEVPLDLTAEFSTVAAPDFTLAKAILAASGSEGEAKADLIKYATSFEGIEESLFDKRKSFGKLLATFQGKWGYLAKK